MLPDSTPLANNPGIISGHHLALKTLTYRWCTMYYFLVRIICLCPVFISKETSVTDFFPLIFSCLNHTTIKLQRCGPILILRIASFFNESIICSTVIALSVVIFLSPASTKVWMLSWLASTFNRSFRSWRNFSKRVPRSNKSRAFFISKLNLAVTGGLWSKGSLYFYPGVI